MPIPEEMSERRHAAALGSQVRNDIRKLLPNVALRRRRS